MESPPGPWCREGWPLVKSGGRRVGGRPVFYRALTRETRVVLRSGGDNRSSAGRNGGAAGGAVALAGGPDGRRRRAAHPLSRSRTRPTAPATGRLRRGEP